MPLKNRQMQIPGGRGLTYRQSETGWVSKRYSSFDSIVQQVIAHRKGNPHLITKNRWSIEKSAVEAEVDNFNTAICKQMGWWDYITEGGGATPVPFQPSRNTPHAKTLLQSLKNVASGGSVLVEWIKDGAEAVPAELANARGLICADCPKNAHGDWSAFFTEPVSKAIRSALEQRKGMKLSTPHDDKLHVCTACSCPIPLKLHMPLDRIIEKLPDESRAALDPRCWILKESSLSTKKD